MLLYIVRHGLTPWNHLHKAQGSADIPLAQEGIDLARRTGEALMDVKFDICFTSPLTRARQTARLVLGGRDIRTCTRILSISGMDVCLLTAALTW